MNSAATTRHTPIPTPRAVRSAYGTPVAMRSGKITYIVGWLDEAGMKRLLADACERAGVATRILPEGVRCRETATERFWFNYSAEDASVGEIRLPPAGVLREDR